MKIRDRRLLAGLVALHRQLLLLRFRLRPDIAEVQIHGRVAPQGADEQRPYDECQGFHDCHSSDASGVLISRLRQQYQLATDA
jgi:hypothetical protein